MITRREFGSVIAGSLALPVLGLAQTVSGVRLGVQTYSFRDLPPPPGGAAPAALTTGIAECGLTECELWSPQIEPAAAPAARGTRPTPDQQQKVRDDLRAWRTETPLDRFRAIRARFNAAGQSIYAFNYSFNTSFTDAEVDRG